VKQKLQGNRMDINILFHQRIGFRGRVIQHNAVTTRLTDYMQNSSSQWKISPADSRI